MSVWKNKDVPYVVKTAAPTTADISYQIPTMWINTVTDRVYFLTDITAGVATWNESIGATLPANTITDPAINAAATTAIIDGYSGVIITLTAAGNAQTLQSPTATAKIRKFLVAMNDTNGAFACEVNGITMSAGEAQWFLWEGSAWIAITAVDADDITATPHGDIVATNTQAYLDELEDEKEKRTHRANAIYVGKHGNDSNDGLTPADAKLTFAGARAAIVTAADAAANNRYIIWCEDAGIYAEDLSGLTYVDIWAPRASINPTNTHTVIDDMAWRIGRVTVPTTKTGFSKTTGSDKSRIRLAFLDCEGTGQGFTCSSGSLAIDIRKINVANGYGIGAVGSTGEIDGRITTIVITGTGTGIGVGASGAGAVFNLRIGNIEDGGLGEGIFIANVAATVNLIVSKIACGTAWNIGAAGTLNIHCPNVTGTRTETGTVNALIGGPTEASQVVVTDASKNLASRAIGIADKNIVEIDQADAATGEYCRATANGIETLSKSETKTDLGYVTASDLNPPAPVAFAGSTGYTITHNYGHDSYQLIINPVADPGGFLGEIWISKSANTAVVYNSGSATINFDYVIIPDA